MQPQLEVVANDGNLYGEGPLWDDCSQSLCWTGIAGHRFFRYNWRRRRHQTLSEGFEVEGFCLEQDGGLLVANTVSIWLRKPGAQPALLDAQAKGQRV